MAVVLVLDLHSVAMEICVFYGRRLAIASQHHFSGRRDAALSFLYGDYWGQWGHRRICSSERRPHAVKLVGTLGTPPYRQVPFALTTYSLHSLKTIASHRGEPRCLMAHVAIWHRCCHYVYRRDAKANLLSAAQRFRGGGEPP